MKSNIGYSSEQVQTIKVNHAQTLAKEVIAELENERQMISPVSQKAVGINDAIALIKQKFNL